MSCACRSKEFGGAVTVALSKSLRNDPVRSVSSREETFCEFCCMTIKCKNCASRIQITHDTVTNPVSIMTIDPYSAWANPELLLSKAFFCVPAEGAGVATLNFK
jgi:hypothetical protein